MFFFTNCHLNRFHNFNTFEDVVHLLQQQHLIISFPLEKAIFKILIFYIPFDRWRVIADRWPLSLQTKPAQKLTLVLPVTYLLMVFVCQVLKHWIPFGISFYSILYGLLSAPYLVPIPYHSSGFSAPQKSSLLVLTFFITTDAISAQGILVKIAGSCRRWMLPYLFKRIFGASICFGTTLLSVALSLLFSVKGLPTPAQPRNSIDAFTEVSACCRLYDFSNDRSMKFLVAPYPDLITTMINSFSAINVSSLVVTLVEEPICELKRIRISRMISGFIGIHWLLVFLFMRLVRNIEPGFLLLLPKIIASFVKLNRVPATGLSLNTSSSFRISVNQHPNDIGLDSADASISSTVTDFEFLHSGFPISPKTTSSAKNYRTTAAIFVR